MRAHRLTYTFALLTLVPLLGCGYSEIELQDVGRQGAPLQPTARTFTPQLATPLAYCDPTPLACVTACGSQGTEACIDGALTGCVPPAEICDNGLDDDCDGLADEGDTDCPPVLRTCEAADGDTCNDDPGRGDRCDPMDNDNGCVPTRFAAWCNRTNPAAPGVFDTYARQWVASRCDGTTTKTGNTYGCTSLGNYRYECTVR